MQGKINYQKLLDELLLEESIKGKRLLLHSCCAPCSSYVLTYLSKYFAITVFYYNPNISEQDEYRKRVEEQKRLIALLNEQPDTIYPINVIEGNYEPQRFYETVRGYEDYAEGGERCFRCYRLRLLETAKLAREKQFDFFTTTLTISPLKNAQKLNEIGSRLAEEYHVACLPSDFKKKGGYQRSIALSREYGLYRQPYCGCEFSRRQAEWEGR